jgi:hypothetical protein
MKHLFGAILKPSMHNPFKERYTASLEVIHVSHSATPVKERERKTPDTSGLTSKKCWQQLDLFGLSLKTSKDTSLSDTEKSNQIWKDLVIRLRKEYSQRKKLALHTDEKDSSSFWPTPDCSERRSSKSKQQGLSNQAKNWATPRVFMFKDAKIDRGKSNLGEQVMGKMNWPTPTPTDTHSANLKSTQQKEGSMHSVTLPQAVNKTWPTPTVAEAGKISNKANYGQVGLSNHPAIVGEPMRGKAFKDRKGVDGQPDQEKSNTDGKKKEQLNPAWVAQLMGTTLEKTFFECMGME